MSIAKTAIADAQQAIEAMYPPRARRNSRDLQRLRLLRRRALKAQAFVEDIDEREVWESSGKRCAICSKDLARFWCRTGAEGWQLDHITPLSRGGKHERSNVQALCCSCNHRKCDRLPDVVVIPTP